MRIWLALLACLALAAGCDTVEEGTEPNDDRAVPTDRPTTSAGPSPPAEPTGFTGAFSSAIRSTRARACL
jgi:hypothetical protein